jgi:hypothetical protein
MIAPPDGNCKLIGAFVTVSRGPQVPIRAETTHVNVNTIIMLPEFGQGHAAVDSYNTDTALRPVSMAPDSSAPSPPVLQEAGPAVESVKLRSARILSSTGQRQVGPFLFLLVFFWRAILQRRFSHSRCRA